jgi:hypothetical protein
MITTIAAMKEKGMRIVVPKWSGDYNGYFKVDRGSMTDEEWKTWLSVNKGEISRQISLFMKEKRPSTELQAYIVNFLTEKGIEACPA